MKVKTVCPLGSECERVVEDHIERCAWYVQIEGVNPQNGDRVNDSKCSMAWQPILMIEQTAGVNQTASSVQALRNVTDKNQKAAIKVMENVKEISDK